MNFKLLNIIEPIQLALLRKKYLVPTPIQEKTIPAILDGKDVFGCAQTGTGKTAAFAIPILQLLYTKPENKNNFIKALILAPTRELALQISDNFREYGTSLGLKQLVVFGGVSQNAQVDSLRKGIDILIATPGRLLDLINQGHINLKNIQFLVLDEADRMLDMGFINDIKKIIAKVPRNRQTMLFSATVPAEIKKLAESLQNNPITINVAPVSSASPNVEQTVYFVEKGDKKDLLKHVLIKNTIDHALVFTRTKHGADKVMKDLNKSGIKAEAIHGNKSQSAREKALKGFKNRSIRVLVATDIASRGIDVDKLTHVINFEIPEQPETYVHRIGRTGRAGESGCALSFCASEEKGYLKNIHKLINKNIATISHPFM